MNIKDTDEYKKAKEIVEKATITEDYVTPERADSFKPDELVYPISAVYEIVKKNMQKPTPVMYTEEEAKSIARNAWKDNGTFDEFWEHYKKK